MPICCCPSSGRRPDGAGQPPLPPWSNDMANWSLLSVHRPTCKGLLQTTWPLLVLGIMCLGFGVMMLFVPTKPGQETGTRIAGVVAILGSLALLGVAPWRWL